MPLIGETLNLKSQPVLISFPTDTLGGLLGWFPYAERLQTLYKCRLEYTIAQEIIEPLAPQYLQTQFFTSDNPHTTMSYATYRVGLCFGDSTINQSIDLRQVDFHCPTGCILGVGPRKSPVRLNLSAPRSINEPYVRVATQSTCQAKYWSNGTSWDEVVTHLKSLGYRVLCTNLHAHYGQGLVWNHISQGAEDFTGKVPLQERVNPLHRVSLFIGLSNRLPWLV